MSTFDCKWTFELVSGDPIALHLAISDAMNDVQMRDVVGSACFRGDAVEDVHIEVAAPSESEAQKLAERVAVLVERAIVAGFGAGSVVRGPMTLQPAPEGVDDLLAQSAAILAQSQARLDALHAEVSPTEPIANPFKVMREQLTNGDNYDVGTEDLIEWFERWSAKLSFHFVSIGAAHATVVFDELPDDVEAFVAEAYKICPDLDNDVEELDEQYEIEDEAEHDRVAVQGIAGNLQREKVLRFWWD